MRCPAIGGPGLAGTGVFSWGRQGGMRGERLVCEIYQDTADDVAQMWHVVDVGQGTRDENVLLARQGINRFPGSAHVGYEAAGLLYLGCQKIKGCSVRSGARSRKLQVGFGEGGVTHRTPSRLNSGLCYLLECAPRGVVTYRIHGNVNIRIGNDGELMRRRSNALMSVDGGPEACDFILYFRFLLSAIFWLASHFLGCRWIVQSLGTWVSSIALSQLHVPKARFADCSTH